MKRKLIFFITATMTFLLLVSCSKSQSYREDVKCTALTRTVRDKVQESADSVNTEKKRYHFYLVICRFATIIHLCILLPQVT